MTGRVGEGGGDPRLVPQSPESHRKTWTWVISEDLPLGFTLPRYFNGLPLFLLY